MKKKISVLGSTGSIGRRVLEVVEKHADRFEVVALAAARNASLLAEQAEKFKPVFIALADESCADDLHGLMHRMGIEMDCGIGAVLRAASFPNADLIVAAISGTAGLLPAYEAVKTGKIVALANKEALGMAGTLIMDTARRKETTILPIDSEHSAVFQALQAGKRNEVAKIILTASGGPFYNLEPAFLSSVTPQEALKHPVWDMGSKVTVDSATMANKGIEVMEAFHLFNLPPEMIDVVIHPQSIVHSMVEFKDGTIIAQMGQPDMRLPIQYALTWPERVEGNNSKPLFGDMIDLHFLPRKDDLFPALPLAYQALRMGDYAAIAYNAADEAAVDAFLHGKLKFNRIAMVIEKVLNNIKPRTFDDVNDVLDFGNETKKIANEFIRCIG